MKYLPFIATGLLTLGCSMEKPIEKPNIIFILTDDQGYGDIAANGNPYINTPNIDRLISESYSFTDFHSGTTSAPTRSGIMTGSNCNSVGVWHTVGGRSLLALDKKTLPEILSEGGYLTAMFGKWHLGDYYPYRPENRGFQEALYHGGGGVGQVPDVWNNNYFNDTYYRNGKKEKFSGYCTDVWFREAIAFIERNKNRKQPFFCYIATNAPHGPFNVEKKYADLYRGNKKIANPNFYGMITNLDEHIGKLMSYLKQSGIYENTIIVYMTDNGTSAGFTADREGNVLKGYNAGMKGKKGSPYEGGHRVPFVIHYPHSKGRKIKALSGYLDIMPTFLEMCGLEESLPLSAEGRSLLPLLEKDQESERFLFADTQREEFLKKGRNSCVMYKKWRLVNSNELYNIEKDPGQRENVAEIHQDLVRKMQQAYDQWWENTVSPRSKRYECIPVGSERQPEVLLYSHDLHNEKSIPTCHQNGVRNGYSHNFGFWAIDVQKEGIYRIAMYRWEPSLKISLNEAAPIKQEEDWGSYNKPAVPVAVKDFKKAELYVDKKLFASKTVDNQKDCIEFTVELKSGKHSVQTDFIHEDGKRTSAYYATINAVE